MVEVSLKDTTEYDCVKCPNCNRTIAHYISGCNAVYRIKCQKCSMLIGVYSAGQTSLAECITVFTD